MPLVAPCYTARKGCRFFAVVVCFFVSSNIINLQLNRISFNFINSVGTCLGAVT